MLSIPDIWRMACTTSILKPHKPADQAKSYIPISLLSPVAKLMESFLLPTHTRSFHTASQQHGFLKTHITTTALQTIHQQIIDDLNKKRPCEGTILIALDLSKAFDTISE